MAWTLIANQLPDLREAFEEVEPTVAEAFSRAVGRYGHYCNPPEGVGFDPESASWSMGWWVWLPEVAGPFELLICQLERAGGRPCPEVSGWIAMAHYAGHGFEIDRELWRSSACPVESPTAAAGVVRRVTAEMVEQLGQLDFGPYLSARHAAPGTSWVEASPSE